MEEKAYFKPSHTRLTYITFMMAFAFWLDDLSCFSIIITPYSRTGLTLLYLEKTDKTHIFLSIIWRKSWKVLSSLQMTPTWGMQAWKQAATQRDPDNWMKRTTVALWNSVGIWEGRTPAGTQTGLGLLKEQFCRTAWGYVGSWAWAAWPCNRDRWPTASWLHQQGHG